MQRQTQNLNVKLFGEPTQAKASGIAFSLAAFLPTLLAFVLLIVLSLCGLSVTDYQNADWYLYLSYTITPFSFIVVAAWYYHYTQTPVKTALKEQKCQPRYFIIAVFMQVGLLSLSELNAWFLSFLEGFGYADSGISLPSMDGFGFVGVLLVVAVLPALFEELLFRGVLQKGLKAFGETGAILLCGALFALYHKNPAQTLYQFCCGAAFAWIAVRSGSILPTVLSHFLNNALILTLEKLGVKAFSGDVLTVVIVISAVCLVAAITWLLVLGKREKNRVEQDKNERKRFFACAAVGIAVCALTWLLTLFTGL